MIRSGPWTIRLRIEKEGRFPRVDECVPPPSKIQSTLRLSGSDAIFLRKALRRIPSSDDLNSPVTVELNGSVTIRAKGHDQSTPTEVVLTGSQRDGDVLRFNTNRDFLSRVIRLGLRDVELSGAESPACCRQGRRVYVWGLLGKEGAIPSSPGAMRTESPAEGQAISGGLPRAKARGGEPEPHSSHTEPVHESGAGMHLANVVRGVEALQASLRESLSRTSALAESLKRQLKPVRSPDAIESKAA